MMYVFFFFNDTATTEIYTLSLHDALPICGSVMHEVTYIRPRNLADAVRLYRTTPGCRPLAGGTDLMVMLHARTLRPEPEVVLDLWSLAELKGVRRAGDLVEIGAAESFTGIIASRDVQQHRPA